MTSITSNPTIPTARVTRSDAAPVSCPMHGSMTGPCSMGSSAGALGGVAADQATAGAEQIEQLQAQLTQLTGLLEQLQAAQPQIVPITPIDTEPVPESPDASTATTPQTPGVSQEQVDAASARNAPTDGLVPQALRNLERANQHGLHLTGGVGTWNEWHSDGSSVDVSNYDGRGFQETPEMRAYADEMYELGRSGATGADGGLLVTHVVYAGMKAGASTGWEWVPVSQPDDITQGHWDHVHVETDSWV